MPETTEPAVEAKAKADDRAKRTLAQRADAGVELTLEELAEVTGDRYRLRPNLSFGGEIRSHGFTSRHMAAAQLHGWNAHALATAEPMTLRLVDYRAALEAASPATGNPTAHPAAVSKFAPKFTQKEP